MAGLSGAIKPPKLNDFAEDLIWSNRLDEVGKTFVYLSHFLRDRPVADWHGIFDMIGQRQGGDLQIGMTDGVTKTVQIKSRREDYPDIAIEIAHLHIPPRIRPGWAYEQSNADWLLYKTPSRAHWMSYPGLIRTWHAMEMDFFESYPKLARNADYWTINHAIHPDRLRERGLLIETAEFASIMQSVRQPSLL